MDTHNSRYRVKNCGIETNELVVFLMDEHNNLIIKPHKVYVNEKV